MPPQAFIRSASPRDLAEISALLGLCWHATYDSIHGAARVAAITADWHSPAALKTQLDMPGSEFIIADTGEKLTGMAYARLDGKTIELRQIYILPEAQGAGLGTAMLQELIDSFPDADRMRLDVDAANEAAIGFYIAGGFAVTGRNENCGMAGSGIPALIMEMPLADI